MSARRPWALAPILISSLIVAACGSTSFITQDIRRPLVTSEKTIPQPESEELLHAYFELYSERNEKRLKKSLNRSRQVRRLLRIQKYNESYAPLSIDRLKYAILEHPDNPFAWNLLGAYLALQQESESAIRATHMSLDKIESAWDRDADLAGRLFFELLPTARINLAIYLNSDGRYEKAIDTLSRIETIDEQSPLLRLAFYWTAAMAFSGAGSTAEAAAALSEAEKVSNENLANKSGDRTIAYPQYQNPVKRLSRHLLVDGLLKVEAGELEAAVETLDRAIEADPKNWDAYLVRANAKAALNKLQAAGEDLHRVLVGAPRDAVFRRDVVFYNLANTLRDRDDLPRARIAYCQALESFTKRRNSLRKDVERMSLRSRLTYVLEPIMRLSTFTEALNNLGNVYATLAQRHPEERSEYEEQAEESFRLALSEIDGIQRATVTLNLVGSLLRQGRQDEAVHVIEAFLFPESSDQPEREWPADKAALEASARESLAVIAGLEAERSANWLEDLRSAYYDHARHLLGLSSLPGQGSEPVTALREEALEELTRAAEYHLLLPQPDFVPPEPTKENLRARRLRLRAICPKEPSP